MGRQPTVPMAVAAKKGNCPSKPRLFLKVPSLLPPSAQGHRGFVFKTGDKGTGYYLDGGQQEATGSQRVETPDDEFDDAEPQGDAVPAGRASRARRPRNARGGRLKRPTRLARLLAAVAAPIILATGMLPDQQWKQAGLWAVDTANANCADTAFDKVLRKSAADVTCLQEVRHKTPQAIGACKRKLRGAGWSAHISLAKTTAADRGSGGCAVVTRKGIGITAVDEELIAEEFRHRLAVAHVSAIVPGGVRVISVYLKDSEGLSEYNLRVLQEAAALVRTLDGPWIMAGDWNVEPRMIQEANWLKVAKGTVVTACLSNCHDHTYDFFVVGQCLSQAVVGVQRLDDAGLNPHAPCRLLLKGDARRHAVRKLHRAPRVPATLPHGPAPRPPSYQRVLDRCATNGGIAPALVEWYRRARSEWAALADAKIKFRHFGLASECEAGNTRSSATTSLAAAWREAARRADDMARITRQKDRCALSRAQEEALQGHSSAIAELKRKLPNGVPKELTDKLGSWAEHHARAVRTDSHRAASSLYQKR